MKYKYSGVVMSDLEAIKFFLEEILLEIEGYIDDENMVFDIRLILNELIINSAIHGNNLVQNKGIKLDIDLKNGQIEISVEDEGEGIDCSVDSYDPLDMKCCGRGLLIVNKLSDQLLIEKNRIMVVKNLL